MSTVEGLSENDSGLEMTNENSPLTGAEPPSPFSPKQNGDAASPAGKDAQMSNPLWVCTKKCILHSTDTHMHTYDCTDNIHFRHLHTFVCLLSRLTKNYSYNSYTYNMLEYAFAFLYVSQMRMRTAWGGRGLGSFPKQTTRVSGTHAVRSVPTTPLWDFIEFHYDSLRFCFFINTYTGGTRYVNTIQSKF